MNGRWLLRLYPRAWRQRYGAEFLALLEQLPTSPRVIFDALVGAADAHLRPQVAASGAAEPEERPAEAAAEVPVTAGAPVAAVQVPEPIGSFIAPRPPRPRLSPEEYEFAIDRQIREAMERGLFDNLEGTGKPLNLEDDSAAGEWALAFRMLKSAGETLPWIALGKEIEADQAKLRARLERAAAYLEPLRGSPSAHRIERDRLRGEYLAAAAALDKKLLSYSAQVPSFRLDKGRLPQHAAAARFDAACPPPTD